MVDIVKLEFQADTRGITKAKKELAELEKKVKGVDEAGKKSASGGLSALRGKLPLIAKGAAGVATALAAAAAQSINAAREIDNLSRIAGLSTTEFQKQAFAAKQVGISQEKYADIIKDTNDKIGDFMNTGAGPMKDFFDVIGPKVGVTIQDFKNLSGPDALGLYVKSLEDAGVNQQEMTFYMEALASDASALTPLLRNNGAEMKKFGDQVKATLSPQQIARAKEINNLFGQMAGTIKTQLQGALIDATTALADFFELTEKGKLQGDIDLATEDLRQWENALIQLRRGELTDLAVDLAELNEMEVSDNWFARDDIEDVNRLMGLVEGKIASTRDRIQEGRNAMLDLETETGNVAEAQDEVTEAASETGDELKTNYELQQANKKATEAAAAAQKKAFNELLGGLNELEQKYHDINAAIAIGEGPEVAIRRQIEEIQELIRFIEFEQRMKEEATTVVQLYNQALEEGAEITGSYAEHAKISAEESEKLNEQLKALEEAGYGGESAIAALNKSLDVLEERLKPKPAEAAEKGPIRKMIEDWKDLRTQVELFKVEGIERTADALAEFATTGSLNFKEFARELLVWAAKMIIRMALLRAIMSAIGAAGPVAEASSTTQNLPQAGVAVADSGGPVSAGKPVLIGTGAQPELFVPNSSGQMYPAGTYGGGGGVTIGNLTVNVQENENQTPDEQAAMIGRAIRDQIKPLIMEQLINQHRPGNMFNNMRGAYA